MLQLRVLPSSLSIVGAFSFFALLSASTAFAAGKLVSGPMLGYRAHREVLVWLETEGAQSVALEYWIAGKPTTAKRVVKLNPDISPAGGQVLKFPLQLLEMGASYEYSVTIDGTKIAPAYPLKFQSMDQWEWRKPAPDFSFLFGSCAYINDAPYDRTGEPYGKTTEIFRHMAASGADFMLWGGDDWYYREADFSSVSGLWYRPHHDRAIPDLQPLLAAMHHYATWDDHDYGSNDANKSFEFKETTLEIFKAYWGNPTWGEPDNPGVYTKFFWGDAAFILMDDRYHRDDSRIDERMLPTKSQYGARQMEWLKQSLIQAKELGHFAFKFVVTGGQVLTSFGGNSETFDYFRRERSEILQFIRDQNITGVVFLSGDVHFTELARATIGTDQAIYELTSSPFTSGAWTGAEKDRAKDPLRVPGTLVPDQNFCVLSIHGPKAERVLTITCFNKTNARRWSHDIRAEELK